MRRSHACGAILDETAKKTYTPAEKASRTMLLDKLAGLYREARQYPKAVETLRQIVEVDPQAGGRASASITKLIASRRISRQRKPKPKQP